MGGARDPAAQLSVRSVHNVAEPRRSAKPFEFKLEFFVVNERAGGRR